MSEKKKNHIVYRVTWDHGDSALFSVADLFELLERVDKMKPPYSCNEIETIERVGVLNE